MTQYLLAVHGRTDDPTPSEAEMQQAYADVDAFNARLQESGAWVFAGGLKPVSEARVIDATDATGATDAPPRVTDGPFSEAKEVLGGFWIIEASDDSAATEIARQASAACHNPVEVRAFESE
jgi:hypothetical protein